MKTVKTMKAVVITTILNYKLRIATKRKPHISLSTRKRCTTLSQERDNSRVPQSPSNSTVRKSNYHSAHED
jgi:hypothetical protein